MKIFFGINKIRKFPRPVLAIGVFDGMHRGHVKILRAAAARARAIRGTSVVLTFWPHPQEAAHLYSLKHRLKLIAGCGIDACVVINFDKVFSRMSADDFARGILFELIHPAYIYVGKNFTFGRWGSGDYRKLQSLSAAYGFGVRAFEVLECGGRPVSSTHIRSLIKRGKLMPAAGLLGRPVSVLGTVVKGKARGTKLGYPTANIEAHHEVVPPSGVYAVRVVVGGKTYSGVCNIGKNPTFRSRGRDRNIEVYIFGFKKNIYGRDCEIRFIKKLRNEKKYANAAILSGQIEKDVLAAKKVLSRH